jgi:hypothetical protein
MLISISLSDLNRTAETAIMLTTKLSSKGQVIIPKEIRNRHHWEPE